MCPALESNGVFRPQLNAVFTGLRQQDRSVQLCFELIVIDGSTVRFKPSSPATGNMYTGPHPTYVSRPQIERGPSAHNMSASVHEVPPCARAPAGLGIRGFRVDFRTFNSVAFKKGHKVKSTSHPRIEWARMVPCIPPASKKRGLCKFMSPESNEGGPSAHKPMMDIISSAECPAPNRTGIDGREGTAYCRTDQRELLVVSLNRYVIYQLHARHVAIPPIRGLIPKGTRRSLRRFTANSISRKSSSAASLPLQTCRFFDLQHIHTASRRGIEE
ncbi:hypothetical protein DFH06DRAFT_1372743 [Mycena polygramma]|nr:hypothetical protein DFH06DRAFT_1372743 [Mycena polygramma]